MTPRARMSPEGFQLRQPTHPERLASFTTSERDLFTVAHLGIAQLDLADWRLAVDGLVEQARVFDFAALCALPRSEVMAVHECAGSPLNPLVPQRRAGNVVWSGPRLADVLAACGLHPDARFVWLTGADHGRFAGIDCDTYRKDLPIDKALAPDTLLAIAINGEPLPRERGFPVRVMAPGWYGTNSVKWVTGITAAATRADGPFTTRFYNDPLDDGGSTPVWGCAPNALIAAPIPNARIHPGALRIEGWTWGDAAIARVEVSVDGGASWQAASVGPRQQYSWQRFALDWAVPGVGEFVLVVRATDCEGRVQPLSARRNRAPSQTIFVTPRP